ncbi:F0F1 ATP synthase subunit epsilon [Thermodesulfobacteriota bacterium]
MNIKIYTPSNLVLDLEVTKVKGEGREGAFCLLQRHIDYVTALLPGILSCTAHDRESFLAVDLGILIKQGNTVMVSTKHAVMGNLGELEEEVEKMLISEDEREKVSRSSVARLEASFVRRFIGFGKSG